ncbi:tyrosine-type recombinase/integrase [Hominifimenecus sp. rT4P-3]|uniref:tyrosine-type recombinase/integrase n=1 Tax=Hominifimenecus sp. rT4P-3 TaxID=3242979 RepID=UPI003DA5BAD6
MNQLTEQRIQAFEAHLYLNEKCKTTIVKYVRAVQKLAGYLQSTELTKPRLFEYRELMQKQSKAQTVNGALSAINSFLDFCGWQDCKVKLLKVQRQAFLDETKELSEAEYKRLLAAAQAKENERLYLLMLTICGTGIRVSELAYITVEAAKAGRTEICMKGKNRTIILQKELRNRLLKYAKKQNIVSGHIFRTKSGRALDRSNICHDMKRLCSEARVDSRKVFPHNLRHLFARTFYAATKNLAHLADVLGHSRIETTRIYVAVSAAAHERILNRMRLIV